jgi:undecaprenyl-diphosphatase
MDLLQAVVLGLVQGVTEFLPISSSGHLELVPWALGWDLPTGRTGRAVDVALHFGTLCAVVAYFRVDLSRYVRSGTGMLVGRRRDADGRLAWLFVLSAVPAAVAGVLFEGVIDEHLGSPAVIGGSLIVFGVVLWVADRRRGSRDLESVGVVEALVIGVAQVLALNPGTSRSGVTISAGRLLGLGRDAAARFAFVMGIPVIAGAFVFEMAALVADGVPEGLVLPMAVGSVTAALSGWVAVWGTLRLVRTRSFAPFVVYRIVLGFVVLSVV